MKKTKVLRKIYKVLRYKPLPEHLGLEMTIDISNSPEIIAEEIKVLLEKHLGITITSIPQNYIPVTIAKAGMIDVTFVIADRIDSYEKNGFQILRENRWVGKKCDDESDEEGLGFIEDMITETEEGKTYVRLFANTINQETDWFKEKAYLYKQMAKGEALRPKPADRIQVFRIEDICFTNYAGIWSWKHFYI